MVGYNSISSEVSEGIIDRNEVQGPGWPMPRWNSHKNMGSTQQSAPLPTVSMDRIANTLRVKVCIYTLWNCEAYIFESILCKETKGIDN